MTSSTPSSDTRMVGVAVQPESERARTISIAVFMVCIIAGGPKARHPAGEARSLSPPGQVRGGKRVFIPGGMSAKASPRSGGGAWPHRDGAIQTTYPARLRLSPIPDELCESPVASSSPERSEPCSLLHGAARRKAG